MELKTFILLISCALIYKVIAAPVATLPYGGDYDEIDYTTAVDPLEDNDLVENRPVYTTVSVTTTEQHTSTLAVWLMDNKFAKYFTSPGQKDTFVENSKQTLKPDLTTNSVKDLIDFGQNGDDEKKTSSVWNFLDDIRVKEETQEEDLLGVHQVSWDSDVTEVSVVLLTPWTLIQIFFADNWLWIFLVLLFILLCFCIPGMVIQVYCNKYYHSYRREKQQDEKPIPIEKNNISTTNQNDHEVDYQEENDSASSFSQLDEQENTVKEENDKDINSTRSILNSAQLIPEEIISVISTCESQPEESPALHKTEKPLTLNETEKSPLPHYRIDVYSGPQVPIYETPPALILQEESPKAPSSLFETPSVPSPATFPSNSGVEYKPVEVYPLHKPKLENSEKDQNTQNEKAAAIGREQIVESNAAYSLETRPPQRQPKEKVKSKPPTRPPKPKQYKIRPFTPVDMPKVDHNDSSSEDKQHKPRRRKQRKHRETQKPTRQNPKKPKENQQTRNRQHKHSTKEQSKPSPNSKNPELENSQMKQIKRRKELLRQIIQGLNEAEMLQCKLERTRKWTRDQKIQTKKDNQSRNNRNHELHDLNKSKRSHSENKRQHSLSHKNNASAPEETMKPKKDNKA